MLSSVLSSKLNSRSSHSYLTTHLFLFFCLFAFYCYFLILFYLFSSLLFSVFFFYCLHFFHCFFSFPFPLFFTLSLPVYFYITLFILAFSLLSSFFPLSYIFSFSLPVSQWAQSLQRLRRNGSVMLRPVGCRGCSRPLWVTQRCLTRVKVVLEKCTTSCWA